MEILRQRTFAAFWRLCTNQFSCDPQGSASSCPPIFSPVAAYDKHTARSFLPNKGHPRATRAPLRVAVKLSFSNLPKTSRRTCYHWHGFWQWPSSNEFRRACGHSRGESDPADAWSITTKTRVLSDQSPLDVRYRRRRSRSSSRL